MPLCAALRNASRRAVPLAAAAAVGCALLAPAAHAVSSPTQDDAYGGEGCNAAVAGLPGGFCHGSADPGLEIALTGPRTLLPGEMADYTVSLTGSLSGLVGAGLSLALAEGDPGAALQVIDAATKALQGTPLGTEITHVGSAQSTGHFEYDFRVTAPASGEPFTLRVAMLGFDGDQSRFFDDWTATTFAINAPEPGAPSLHAAALLALGLLARRRGRRRDRAGSLPASQ